MTNPRNTEEYIDDIKIGKDGKPYLGRTYGSQNPELEETGSRYDISSIDQQEGNMKHGECGGGICMEEEESS